MKGTQQTSASSFARSNPGFVLTLTAIFTFGYLYVTLMLFYEPFDVRPSDVGLGYQQTLVESAGILALFVLYVSAVAFLARVARRLFGWPKSPKWPVALFLIGLVLGIPYNAHHIGMSVAAGHTTYTGSFKFGGIWPAPFSTPSPVAVSASATDRPLPYDLAHAAGCLLYLGAANGVDVFYEPAKREVVRVPTALITVDVAQPPLVRACS